VKGVDLKNNNFFLKKMFFELSHAKEKNKDWNFYIKNYLNVYIDKFKTADGRRNNDLF